MPTLPLALKIADAVTHAGRHQRQLDIAAIANLLLDAHPEAGHSLAEIADTLREEVASQRVLAQGTPAMHVSVAPGVPLTTHHQIIDVKPLRKRHVLPAKSPGRDPQTPGDRERGEPE